MQPQTDPSAPQPRLWVVELGGLREGAPARVPAAAPAFRDAVLARLAGWSGMGLALAHLLRVERGRAGFVVAVGDAVRRGLPTAARATVLGPSPLTGALAEGAVGSDLARRLAAVCDVLALEGRVGREDGVLVVAETGVRVERRPAWAALSPVQRWHAAQREFGPCAVLRTGPAAGGDAPVAFANLAAGGEPPSFVGRGLGGTLARHGLCAIVVTAEPRGGEPAGFKASAARGRTEGPSGLEPLLLRSPRLAARAEGGTLELGAAFAARGELLDGAAAADLQRGAEEARTGRHGCRGCPTPCGWVFQSSSGAASGARFSAVQALGAKLGLAGFGAPGELLACCNDLGLDAKEAGAGLGLLVRAGEAGRIAGAPARGDLAGLLAALEGLVAGQGPAAILRGGAAAAAVELGVPIEASGREAVRGAGGLGALLGACLGIRGAEPMRTFPFLLEGGAGAERLARLLRPWDLPPDAQDPAAAAGTGRVVAWHEDLVAGLDLTGFCAFSAAGLLGDDVCGLDELVPAIAPASIAESADLGRTPGERLLGAGAGLLAALRELRRRWGSAPPAVPRWAAERLAAPGVADEYRQLRRLDGAGELEQRAWALVGLAELRVAPPGAVEGGQARAVPGRTGPSAGGQAPSGGRVHLVAGGALGRRLGAPLVLECELPCAPAEVLRLAAERVPAAADWLLRDGQPLPSLWRGGALLGPGDLLEDGDRVELILAVSGG